MIKEILLYSEIYTQKKHVMLKYRGKELFGEFILNSQTFCEH